MSSPSYVSPKYLLKISIPVFFANLAVPLVGLVDTGLMGHLDNEKFLASISIATSVLTMIFWSFGFLRMGTVGLVSQAYGKRDYNEIFQTIIRNLIIAIIIGLIIILFKEIIVFSIEYFFITSYETQELIEKYISIRILSAPAELMMYVFIALYLGIQKTKISSLFVGFFCLINIILSYYFVASLNLNISGAALGTTISAYLTIIIFTIFSFFYFKNKIPLIVKLKIIFNRRKFFKLFNINFDIFIRTVLLTFAFLWVTYQSSKLGESFLAINTILMQFIMLASFFLDSFAFSTEAVVGYTIGRKNKKNFLLVVSNTFKLSIITSLIISLIYILFFKNILSMLTDLEYLRYLAYSYAGWIIFIPPIASLCYQLDGIFIGASQTAEMRNGMIFSVVLFVISSNFLVGLLGNHGLWMSFLFLMIFRTISLNFYFNRILKNF